MKVRLRCRLQVDDEYYDVGFIYLSDAIVCDEHCHCLISLSSNGKLSNCCFDAKMF